MINRERLCYLFDRYIQNTCSPAEKQEFFQLLADPSYEERFRQISELYDAVPSGNTVLDTETTEAVWEAIRKGIPVADAPVRRMRFVKYWWAAAAILIVLSGAVTWYLQPVADPLPATAQNKIIIPGSSGAVLTLADGKTIVLDSLQNRLIASQHGANVLLVNGQLSYKPVNNPHLQPGNEDITYNTLTIPRGRKFRLVLPDGTKVWLNAASSLRYPTAFTGSRRTVDVSGEAYFEVAHNASKPFIVNIFPSSAGGSREGAIEVLGTHFNVHAYSDEPAITTTLLEGRVKFIPPGKKENTRGVMLQPGQELVFRDEQVTINTVDTEPAVAWINDMFSFKSADLQMVLRQLARWYDVDIQYDETIKARFSGSIYRSEDFYELLKIIEFTSNVKFIINQKTIKVLPQQ